MNSAYIPKLNNVVVPAPQDRPQEIVLPLLTTDDATSTRISLGAAFVGRDEQQIARELDALIPLFESGLIQEEEFLLRKQQLLKSVSPSSEMYQIYAVDMEDNERRGNQQSLLMVDGQEKRKSREVKVPEKKLEERKRK